MIEPHILVAALFTVLAGMLYAVGVARTKQRAHVAGKTLTHPGRYGSYFALAVCTPAILFYILWAALSERVVEYRVMQGVPPEFLAEFHYTPETLYHHLIAIAQFGEKQIAIPDAERAILLPAASYYNYVRYIAFYIAVIGCSLLVLLAYLRHRKYLSPDVDTEAFTKQRSFYAVSALTVAILCLCLEIGSRLFGIG